MISGVVYLVRIFKMFHRLMNNLVYHFCVSTGSTVFHTGWKIQEGCPRNFATQFGFASNLLWKETIWETQTQMGG